MTPVYWIDNEWEQVKALLSTGLTVRQVAKKVGREPRSIWSKMRTERLSPEERKRGYDLRNAARRLKEKERRKQFPPRLQVERVYTAHEKCPEHVLAERARVMAAQRSPIDEILGVPPPGRSALDRKLSGV